MGASTADDAGVFQLSEDVALVQTVDFFTPIVNDPYLFGRVAAANALSDVYAMGGTPLTAMNICCFPIKDHPPEVFRRILAGGLETVHAAGAVLAGGHSVEDPELKYGLAVTGLVHPKKIISNAGLAPGQKLILTKPLGTGVLATALKAGLLSPVALQEMTAAMTSLNDQAAEVMRLMGVRGATDITGFGLLGHALELAAASRVCLAIEAASVPIMTQARDLAAMGMVPLGSHRNKAFCSHSISIGPGVDELLLDLMADAQTSGGILMGVAADKAHRALDELAERGVKGVLIGEVLEGLAGTLEIR